MNLDLIEKPLLRQSGRTALAGPTRFLLVAIGFLPFISTVKLPPLPSFWAEWIAACLAVALLAASKAGVRAYRPRDHLCHQRHNATSPRRLERRMVTFTVNLVAKSHEMGSQCCWHGICN